MKTIHRLTLILTAGLTLAALVSPPALADAPENSGWDLVDPGGRGSVTLDEYLAIFVDKNKAAADFTAMDANRDGLVSKDEFMAAQQGPSR